MSLNPLHRGPRTRHSHADPMDRPLDQRPAVDATTVDGRPVIDDRPLVDDRPVVGDRSGVDEPVVDRRATDRASVVARQKEAFGGVKIGSAFFGWLTATGTAVLLTAVIAAAGTAIGVASGAASSLSTQAVPAVGVRADVAVLIVMLLAYYCGGYVAGRMARFNGIKQGVAVWVWGVLVGLVVAALGAIAGSRFDLLATLNGFPRLSVNTGDLGHAAVTAVLAVVAALVGAVLGGLAGMRFHRRVDRAGLGR
ncbi:MAG TPA: hypothetical protein VHN80_07665 [Kineosporiaceae bacterium]|nr:hypothetical protein [Kineosporiaceae bacterium]